MDTVAAADGLAALDALWGAVAAGRPFDLVLLDAPSARHRRPVAGRQAPQAARAVDGADHPADFRRPPRRPGPGRELRLDAHLLKPVQQDELLEAIHRVMPRTATRRGVGPRARPGAPTASPLRILVAEDNEFNAQLLEQLLVRRGHRVRLASNGREALALAGGGTST